jgi:predicted patatin/cPLA2 family phospholipase
MYASASFPAFFEPAVVGDELCTDGGVRDVAPIGRALDLGAADVDVILCSDPAHVEEWKSTMPGVLPYMLRAADLMSTEVLMNDVKICLLKNRLPEYGHVNLRVLKPTRPLGDSFDFSPKESERRMQIGYEDACDL